ncbi:MAG TPA: hypothetical protein VGL53_26385 [Bryobacteraceae bacterium]|jgi:hypothetical protein
MTKIQLDYDLLRKLNDDDAEGIANVHAYYGIQKVRIAPGLDRISVDYDATRMSPSDLDNVLVRYGVPVVTMHRGSDDPTS